MATTYMIGKGKAVHASASIATSGMTECGKGTRATVTDTGPDADVTCKLCLRTLVLDGPVITVDMIRHDAAMQVGTADYAREPRRFRAGPAGKRKVGRQSRCHR